MGNPYFGKFMGILDTIEKQNARTLRNKNVA